MRQKGASGRTGSGLQMQVAGLPACALRAHSGYMSWPAHVKLHMQGGLRREQVERFAIRIGLVPALSAWGCPGGAGKAAAQHPGAAGSGAHQSRHVRPWQHLRLAGVQCTHAGVNPRAATMGPIHPVSTGAYS